MARWWRQLKRQFAHAQLLVEFGAPDPRFDVLIAEIESFRFCVAALAFSEKGEA